MRQIFIGGMGRSGTTLLVDLLGFHPDLSPIYETHFVLQILQVLAKGVPEERDARIRQIMHAFAAELPHLPDNKRPYERFAHGPHHVRFTGEQARARTEQLLADLRVLPVRRALSTFVGDLFAQHAAADGKPHWVNKTPMYLVVADSLRFLFPDMLLLHIVRDGRDVAASSMTRAWGPRTIEEAAQSWARGVERARDFGARHPDSYHELTFEALVERPHETLAGIFGALGEPVPEGLVERYVARMGPLDGSRIGAHREVFTAEDHAAFAAIAGDALERGGYAVAVA